MIDSHHHVWDPRTASYPWLTDDLAPIRRPFCPDDLRPLLAAAGVDRTALVQVRSSLDETRHLLGLAAATDFIAGVVGWADLTAPALPDTLAALQAGPGGPFLVGIRHQVHDEPDPNWLRRPAVHRGLAAVRDAGLAFDLLVRIRELPAALDAIRALPDLRFVLDHAAKPRIAGPAFDTAWEATLAPFAAERHHLWSKVSGLVTEANWHTWTPADLQPYVQRVVAWFGPERLLFGSDWPVCLLAASYPQVVEAAYVTLTAALGGLSPTDQAAIFGGNAAAVYRLPASGT